MGQASPACPFILLLAAAALLAAQQPQLRDLESQAAAARARGDASGALAAWQKAAALDPKSARIQDEIGFLLAVLNRRDEASGHFERALALDPKFAPAQYHLGVAFWLANDPAQAIPHLQSAAALDPKSFDYRFYLGQALNATSQFSAALPNLAAATTLNPKSSEAWNQLGLARQRTGDTTAAIEAYRRAVALSPGNLDARNNLGFVLVNSGRAEEGLAQFEKILAADPANNMARVNAGFAHLQKADLDRAAAEFREVLRRDPNSAIAHYDLGVALKQKDDLESAKTELALALSLDPQLAEGALHPRHHPLAERRVRPGRARNARRHRHQSLLRRGVLHARHGAQAERRTRCRRDRPSRGDPLRPRQPGPVQHARPVTASEGRHRSQPRRVCGRRQGQTEEGSGTRQDAAEEVGAIASHRKLFPGMVPELHSITEGIRHSPVGKRTEMALEEYRRKRDFQKTPEPPPGRSKVRQSELSYLVQKHDATRLHYDFRLELDGVLLSWAVTKGPSIDPADKRLAVRTEDHPLSYGSFEGTIPKGQYGGGTVMLWDTGTWEPLDDPHAGLKKGHLSFALHGNRLKGRWDLVRMHGDGKRENWLLIKHEDQEAEQGKGGELLKDTSYSVTSGRSMDEIAKGARPRVSKRSRSGSADGLEDLMRRYPEVQLATLADTAPDGADWLHEIKFDGYRLLAFVADGECRLRTRNGKDWTGRFPSLTRALHSLKAKSAVLDMEAVILNAEGKSSFQALQAALGDEGSAEGIVASVFDILHLDGTDLTKLPLSRAEGEVGNSTEAFQAGRSSLQCTRLRPRRRVFLPKPAKRGWKESSQKRSTRPMWPVVKEPG